MSTCSSSRSRPRPQPDLLLADRLLLRARKAGIETALVINKTDLALDTACGIARQYRGARCPVLLTNAGTGEGVPELMELAAGRIVAFAGQSAVGKSSLMNVLCRASGSRPAPSAASSAAATPRARRSSCRWRRAGTWADTPGFSLLELDAEDPANLRAFYPEFEPYEGLCPL